MIDQLEKQVYHAPDVTAYSLVIDDSVTKLPPTGMLVLVLNEYDMQTVVN